MVEEELKEIEVTAQRVKNKIEKDTGILWEDMSPEERATLYKDYATAEGVNQDEIDQGMALMTQDNSDMIQTGRLHHANWGGTAGNLAQAGAGAYLRKKAKDRQAELSKQKAQAYELAGGLAAGQANAERQHQKELFNKLSSGGQQNQAKMQGQQNPSVGGTVPPTIAAGGGPASPPGTFPQGGPPIRPGNPGAPTPNAPMAPGARPGQAAQPVPGNQQQMTDTLMGMMPQMLQGSGNPGAPPPQGPPPVGTPGINPAANTSSLQDGQSGGAMMKEMMEKIKLDELLKMLRMGG